MTILVIFLLNTCLISSLMCLNDRLTHKIPLTTQRSFCWHCGHVLAWFDLIPIVSALLTNSRCRYCQKSYGYTYVLFECLGGIIGTWLFPESELWLTALCLFFLALEDWDQQAIHANLLFPWLAYLVWIRWETPQLLVVGMFAVICLWLIYVRHALGSGDLPVLMVIGLVSSPIILALTLLTAALITYGYLQYYTRRCAPFVPFLLVSWLSVIAIEKVTTSVM